MNNNFNTQTPPRYTPAYTAANLSGVMKRVYLKMTLALIVTALTALFVSSLAPSVMMYIASHSFVYWGLFIVEILLVVGISGRIRSISSSVATMLFFLFAIVNGLTFSIIFAVYTGVSLFKTFLITAGTFGAMSVYGYFTNRDLSRMGSILYMALFGLIICCVVNMIWPSSTMEWIISFAGVIIFVGLTAWDTQQIRNIAETMPDTPEAVSRIATVGALTLYLDFINLFLYLLRFFGNRD